MVFHKNYIYFLTLILIGVWLSVFAIDSNVHVIACDVGQGDAILIQKATTQVLIDGGPDNSVVNCLGKYMPYWDRTIELVILTHPQADHYEGLIDVFKSYKVANFGQYNTNSSNQGYSVLRNLVGGTTTRGLHLTKGTNLRLGMMQLDILWPNENSDLTNIETKSHNVNDDGVVVKLKYAQFSALFTADVENQVSDIISTYPEIQNLNYIKVNHHGSRNGMSEKLLSAVEPEVAIISNAKKNSYGHPHKDLLNLLDKYKVKVLRTDEIGNVEIITNGENFWLK